ncbi:MAG: type II toxin-antitoxin system VapC family toxin [Crenarchaeota archaeon]|nr:type II toxin-antitoxin system VapC family toxin [Thermoproteota archaeon]
MERVVVDANVLVKWFVPEDYSEYAVLLRNDHLLGCVEAVAPVYAVLEFGNTVRKYYSLGVVDGEKASKIMRLFWEVRVSLKPIEEGLVWEALRYSMENHVTLYDAYYIVLAHSLNAPMYTADEKLLRRLSGVEDSVLHIREYRPRCSEQ